MTKARTDVGNATVPDTSRNNMNSVSNQQASAAKHLALTHLATGAPPEQTLACILDCIEDKNAGIFGAIFLFDDEGRHLREGAASCLSQEHVQAIQDIVIVPGLPAHRSEDIRITQADTEAAKFWQSFCALARQHGVYACAAIPVCSAANRLLGIFFVCSKKQHALGDEHRPAIADAVLLASIAIERDITEARMKTAENSKTIMALAIEGSGTGIWDRNIPTGEIDYSDGWKAILGYTRSEISNRIEDSYTRIHPDDLAFVKATIQAHFDQKTESYAVEHRIRCKDGSYKWISSRGKVVSRDAEGKPLRMIGTTTDITTMRALSDRLRQSVDLITNLTNQVPGLVYQYRQMPNGDAFFSYASEGIRDIYELAPQQVAENVSLVHRIIHPDDFSEYAASLQASAAKLMPWHLEYRVVLPRQGLRWRQADARPHRLPDGGTLWHGFITDITERKRIELELQGFATIDFLTQLPNRRCFMTRIEEELVRVQRCVHTRAAVLMCDLDHFKDINDSHGHATGDLILRHFANILRNTLRTIDTAGRVGGEEFAVVLPGAGIDEARVFAGRLQKKMAQTPFLHGDRTIQPSVSIGIAAMNTTDSGAEASLLRSDKALYRAKENGRNRIETFVD